MELQNIPQAKLQAMALHDITSELGTPGLIQRFNYELVKFPDNERIMANQAFMIAHYIHASDRRQNEPYINHPLRVALRTLVHFEVTDIDFICADLLHDGVEDQPKKLAFAEAKDLRESALGNLSWVFNPRVARMIEAVTNPVFDPTRDKTEQYIEHLGKLATAEDPEPIVVKLSDVIDNASGLLYATGEMVPRLSNRYVPALPIMQTAVMRPDVPLKPHVKQMIHTKLQVTHDRLVQYV